MTDAQHQGIVADLNALAVGVVPAPATGDIDDAATTLGDAAVAGSITGDALEEINGDLAADATDADDWTDDITGDADDLLAAGTPDPDPVITDPTDPGDGSTLPIETLTGTGTFSPTAVLLHPAYRIQTSHEFSLDTQSGQNPSNQYYYGSVDLVTRQVAGSTTQTKLYVEALGLPLNNPYTVAYTRKSDGASVTLGAVNVQTVSDFQFNLYLPAETPDTYDESVETFSLGKTVFGGDNSKKGLPAGFDAADVATVTVTDAQGITRLSGQAHGARFNYRNRLTVLHLSGSSTVVPAPSGAAKMQSRGAYGLYLSARHLPSSQTVTLLADGVAVGEFTTGAHGRLVVTQRYYGLLHTHSGASLHPQSLAASVNLSAVKSLSLTDAQGNVLLSGSLVP